MKPTIMKFGGTSVEDANAFLRAADIVSDQEELRPVVVVSAISGMTDALIASADEAFQGRVQTACEQLELQFQRHVDIADKLLAKPAEAKFLTRLAVARKKMTGLLETISTTSNSKLGHVDALLSYGERLSSLLLAAVLQGRGTEAVMADARDCIKTNDDFGCAAPLMPLTAAATQSVVNPVLEKGVVPVIGGFIGSTLHGDTTTLGRGGSDYTAALVGSALSAREIQIWTDVTGVLTADPRVVPHAETIPRLSYAEAAELAYFGAKVLHPKTIQPAVESCIPVRICNSRHPKQPGTLVMTEAETSPQTVKAIAHKTRVTTIQITSARMLGAYGFLRALFEVFDRHRTAVDVVTTSEVSVSLSLDDVTSLPEIISELEKLGTVRVEQGRAIICVVGTGLCGTPGIAARVFSTISDINVTLISQGASSINLTFAVENDRVKEVVSRLHATFFENGQSDHSELNSEMAVSA